MHWFSLNKFNTQKQKTLLIFNKNLKSTKLEH